MDLRQLSRAIKKALEDTEKVVDDLNLAAYNERFKTCLLISDPRQRLYNLKILLEEVDPQIY